MLNMFLQKMICISFPTRWMNSTQAALDVSARALEDLIIEAQNEREDQRNGKFGRS